MTVQGIAPAGKNPFGLPPAGKSKKADGNPADPGFASLLAGMVAPPGAAQAPGLLPVGESGEASPPGLAEGLPLLPTLPDGTSPVATVPATPESPANQAGDSFGQVVRELLGNNKEAGTPGPGGNPQDQLDALPVTPEAPARTPELPVPGVNPPALGSVTPPVETPPAETLPVTPPTMTTTPDDRAAGDDGAATGPVEPQQPAPAADETGGGNAFGHDRENGHRNNPDLTRGLERAAQVSNARENLPVEAPNSDKLPIPPIAAQPVDPPGVTPPEPGLPPSLESLRNERHEPGRLMQAISRAVNATREGNYTVTLRLHPEHLGEVRLQLSLNGREVTTVMEVASADARQQLESRGDQLRQNLNQAGLTLSGFSVSTGQNQQSPRERQQAFEQALQGRLNGGGRKAEQAVTAPAGAIEQIRNAGRRTGRFDTMA